VKLRFSSLTLIRQALVLGETLNAAKDHGYVIGAGGSKRKNR
jgi:hypothetical protein